MIFVRLKQATNSLFFKTAMMLIIASFIFWGVADIFRGDGYNDVLMSFKYAEPITRSEFEKAKKERLKYIQSMIKEPLSAEEMENLAIDNMVMEGLINQRLFNSFAKNLSLEISDENIAKQISNSENFLDNEGNFSKKIFWEQLRNMNMSEQFYINEMRKNLQNSILMRNFLLDDIKSNDLFKLISNHINQKFSVNIIKLSSNNSKNIDMSFDLSELESYYNKNLDKFISSEKRDLEYFTFDTKTINITDKEITDYYKDNIKDYSSPELFSFYQIESNEKSKLESISQKLDEQAYNLNSLTKEFLRKNSKEFFKMNIEPSKIDANVLKELKSASENKSTNISQNKNGEYYILIKQHHAKAKNISLEQAKKSIKENLLKEKLDKTLVEVEEKIQNAIDSGEDLMNISKNLGIKLDYINNIEQQNNILPENVNLVINDLLEGDLSSAIKISDNIFSFVRIAKIHPARQLTFEEAKDNIYKFVREEKNFVKNYEFLNKIKISHKDNSILLSEAKKYGAAIDSLEFMRADINSLTNNYPQELIASILSLKKGEVSPIIKSDNNLYIAIIHDIKKIADKNSDEKISERFSQNFSDALLEEISYSLRKRYIKK